MRVCDRCAGKLDVQEVVQPNDTLLKLGITPAPRGPIDLCEPCRFTYHNMVDGFLNHYQPPPIVCERTWDRNEVVKAVEKAVLDYPQSMLVEQAYVDEFVRKHL